MKGAVLFAGRGVAQDRSAAATYFRLAAAQGSTEGLWMHGHCLKFGIGAPVDEAAAMAAFEKAAHKVYSFHFFFLFNLGVCAAFMVFVMSHHFPFGPLNLRLAAFDIETFFVFIVQQFNHMIVQFFYVCLHVQI